MRRPRDQIIRRPRLAEIAPRVVEVSLRGAPRRIFSPAGLLLLGFIFLSGVGGLLLALPVANNEGVFTSLDLSYFTAISAVTVTGHTVVNTSTYWSPFGQVVIFLLMLIGGLGFMVLATILLLLLGGRSTLQERLLMRGLMQDTVGVGHLRELRRVGRTVVLVVFLIYGLGTIGIFFQIRGLDGIGLGEGIWNSLFLSVSSFNNAGFNILPEEPAGSSLARFATEPIFLFIPTVLMVIGGLGWLVLVDIYRRRHFSRFNLNTKLVISTSLFLWIFGAGFLLLGEFANPNTLGRLEWYETLANAAFGSVSGRTAGFATIDFSQVADPTKLTFSVLMFIGGGAGSVAGGIKVATFGLIVAAVISALRGRSEVEAFGRRLHPVQFYRAIAVAVVGVGLITITAPILTITDPDVPFVNLLFDTVSAFGTTGASTGIVPELSLAGKSIFMAAMLLGRLGPVAFALMVPESDSESTYRFVRERVEIS